MSEPTRQEVIDAYRELYMLLGFYQDRNPERAPKTREVIENVLPPCPRPTMNEIEWDDDEHFLAEAEHPDWGKVVMLRESALIIFVQPIEKRMGDIHVARVEELTPTGRRYTLTEVQE